MLEIVRSKAPYVHRNWSIVTYSYPLSFFVLIRYLTINTHNLCTLYTSSQILICILRANTTCNSTIVAQSIAYTETYHCIAILATLWKFRKELADYHKAITIIEIITVDNTERLVDNIFSHQYSMIGTPRLLTAFWYRKAFRKCIQRLKTEFCRNMSFIF